VCGFDPVEASKTGQDRQSWHHRARWITNKETTGIEGILKKKPTMRITTTNSTSQEFQIHRVVGVLPMRASSGMYRCKRDVHLQHLPSTCTQQNINLASQLATVERPQTTARLQQHQHWQPGTRFPAAREIPLQVASILPIHFCLLATRTGLVL